MNELLAKFKAAAEKAGNPFIVDQANNSQMLHKTRCQIADIVVSELIYSLDDAKQRLAEVKAILAKAEHYREQIQQRADRLRFVVENWEDGVNYRSSNYRNGY